MEIVVSICMAVIALIAILSYLQFLKFVETWRISVPQYVENIEKAQVKFNESLCNMDEVLSEAKVAFSEIRDKLDLLERDIAPLARTFDKTLIDAEPLVKNLGAGSESIKKTFDHISKTTGAVAEVSEGIREVVVPTINNIRSILFGLSEGYRILKGDDK
jgi:archaellum component FlaC